MDSVRRFVVVALSAGSFACSGASAPTLDGRPLNEAGLPHTEAEAEAAAPDGAAPLLEAAADAGADPIDAAPDVANCVSGYPAAMPTVSTDCYPTGSCTRCGVDAGAIAYSCSSSGVPTIDVTGSVALAYCVNGCCPVTGPLEPCIRLDSMDSQCGAALLDAGYAEDADPYGAMAFVCPVDPLTGLPVGSRYASCPLSLGPLGRGANGHVVACCHVFQ